MGYMESLCDRLFEANGEPLEQGWGPNLRVLDTRNTITYGGKWLRKKDGGSSGGPRIGNSGERNDTGNSVSQSKNYGKLVNDDLDLQDDRDDRDLILVFKLIMKENPVYGNVSHDFLNFHLLGVDLNGLLSSKPKKEIWREET